MGAFYRLGDAVVTNIRLHLGGLAIGVSYDINMSDLTRATQGMGGPEFMLEFRSGFNKDGRMGGASRVKFF